jgi:hypothetical protein
MTQIELSTVLFDKEELRNRIVNGSVEQAFKDANYVIKTYNAAKKFFNMATPILVLIGICTFSPFMIIGSIGIDILARNLLKKRVYNSIDFLAEKGFKAVESFLPGYTKTEESAREHLDSFKGFLSDTGREIEKCSIDIVNYFRANPIIQGVYNIAHFLGEEIATAAEALTEASAPPALESDVISSLPTPGDDSAVGPT